MSHRRRLKRLRFRGGRRLSLGRLLLWILEHFAGLFLAGVLLAMIVMGKR